MNDTVEEIHISAAPALGFVELEADVPTGDTRELDFGQTQHNKLRAARRTVLVFNRAYIGFREGKKKEKVALAAFMAPKPEVTLSIAWLYIALTVLSVAGTSWSFYQSYLSVEINLGLAVLSVIFLLLSVYRSSHRALYSTEKGEIPLFELYVNVPNKERYTKLTEKLSRRIHEAKSKLPTDKNRLALELAEHRRLQKTGTITKEQYELAKQTLFKQH